MIILYQNVIYYASAQNVIPIDNWPTQGKFILSLHQILLWISRLALSPVYLHRNNEVNHSHVPRSILKPVLSLALHHGSAIQNFTFFLVIILSWFSCSVTQCRRLRKPRRVQHHLSFGEQLNIPAMAYPLAEIMCFDDNTPSTESLTDM